MTGLCVKGLIHGELETVVKGNDAFKLWMEIDFIPAVSQDNTAAS